MEILTLNETHLKDVLALSEYAFQYKVPENEIEDRLNMYKKHTIFGIFDEQKLAAKLHIIPLESYFGEKRMKMGGIASVATYPEYRRKGYVKSLIHHALSFMKENGYSISMLHPFDVSFYRKFGWELFSEWIKSTLHKKDLVPMAHVKGTIRRYTKDDHPKEIEQVYETFSKQYSGMLVRTREWWLQRVYSDHVAVYYDEAGQATGYMMYKVEKRKLTIDELVVLTNEARYGLWNFICQHDSMVEEVEMVTSPYEELFFLLREPRIQQVRKPYFMARIVDVEAFLKQFPFEWENGKEEVVLHIQDDVATWNNGSYVLKNGEVYKVKEERDGVTMSIQTLAAISLGYKRPTALYQLALIHGNQAQIQRLEQIVPKRNSFFYDFF